jgi:sugar phosphate isomerase/epimerase
MKALKVYIFLVVSFIGLCLPNTITSQQRYRVAACDWMMLKRQKIGEFSLMKQLKGDGVEMDMGGLGKRDSFENKLRDPDVAKIFRRTSDSLGIEVPAIAMSGLYGQNFSTHRNYRYLVEDCLNTMDIMGAKVAFLPLGGCGNDWTTNAKVRNEVIKRLKVVGDMAAARGKVIGIDTPLDASGNIKLLNEINSKGIKIFYKFQTIIDNHWDLYRDLTKLGKDHICMIHCSNVDGYVLSQDPAIDMHKVKDTLGKMGWSGWLIVERSRDKNEVHNVKKNYGANIAYLKQVFQK